MELSEREYERVLDTVRTASEWHGGQWSPLYSYSSTGKIHGADHRDDLLSEIDSCIEIVETGRIDPDEDLQVLLAALEHLRYTVECWPNEVI